jgi:hypothetical protein
VRRHFGGFAEDIARGLSVRHDHGSQFKTRVLESAPPAGARYDRWAAASDGLMAEGIFTVPDDLARISQIDYFDFARQSLIV